MALATRITNAAAIAACNAITALANSGKLRIYSGTQPVNADTGLSGNTLLAELTLSATAFGSAVDATDKATATANTITADSSADAAGTAAWFRVIKSDGTTTAWDGSAGVGASFDLNLNTTTITLGANVSVSSWTFTMPEF